MSCSGLKCLDTSQSREIMLPGKKSPCGLGDIKIHECLASLSGDSRVLSPWTTVMTDLPLLLMDIFNIHCLSPPKAPVAYAKAWAIGAFGSERLCCHLVAEKTTKNNGLKTEVVHCYSLFKLHHKRVHVYIYIL